MEKGPDFRIVGGASPEAKEQARKKLKHKLFNHLESLPDDAKDRMRKYEYPKDEKELAVIGFINRENNVLMEKYGLEPYSVPVDNFHLISHDLYKEHVSDHGIARTFYFNQGIVFDAAEFRARPIKFGSTAYHELLHLKGHTALEVEETPKEEDEEQAVKRSLHRAGLSVHSSLKNDILMGMSHEHFRGLHEAVVSAQQKKFVNTMISLPMFSADKEWMESEKAKEVRRKIAEEKKISEDDIYWVDKDGKDYGRIFYPENRKVLAYVLGEIQKRFPEEFASVDNVFDKFLEAQFTGRLLSLAKLVDGTFGKGSFRILGNMEDNDTSPPLILENLMKNRAQFLKNKNKF